MSEVLKLAKSSIPEADAEGFIRTETAEDILRSLALVRSINGPAVTLISGAPGIGKTETLLHSQRQDWDGSIYVSIAKGEGNPFHVASRILSQFGDSKTRGKGLDELRQVVGAYVGKRRILLVDEAQNLFQRHKLSATKGSSFGWLVAASEEGGFDLAFCGDLTLPSIFMEFPHLQSRMRRPVVVKSVSRADVSALAQQEGLSGRVEVDLLAAIAKLPGGLRNVENVIRMASIFAGREKVSGTHLKAAVDDLKLHQSGTKQ
ncbi:AAA family ATPase [Cypionkella sp.]|uniref:AAA family ATPase n=1 Tax=Cypionkella sp. TaxID=2811411 RepID=UPI002ABAE52E|nr:AAA family ATPase [Cypionkella sp.]MDZ4392963.1 AAA family ATPase [Cypionkella sp.]